MSIPAGLMIEKWGEKVVLFIGFLMPLIGSLLFAFHHNYPVLLVSCFIIGLGMAMLQTVMNPLQRTVGGEENYAFVGDCSQVVFSLASFVSPLVFTYYVAHPMSFAPEGLPWISLYYLFGFILVAMLLVVLIIATLDEVFSLLPVPEAMLYLFSLSGVCVACYMIFSLSVLGWVGYVLYGFLAVVFVWRYLRCFSAHCVCGKCGARMHSKGRCTRCKTVNV